MPGASTIGWRAQWIVANASPGLEIMVVLLAVRISKNLRPWGPVTKQLRMSGLNDENSNVNTDGAFPFELGSAPNVGGCDELDCHGFWLID